MKQYSGAAHLRFGLASFTARPRAGITSKYAEKSGTVMVLENTMQLGRSLMVA